MIRPTVRWSGRCSRRTWRPSPPALTSPVFTGSMELPERRGSAGPMSQLSSRGVRYNGTQTGLEIIVETLPTQSQTEPVPAHAEPAEWKRFLLDLVETIGLAIILFVIINTVSA